MKTVDESHVTWSFRMPMWFITNFFVLLFYHFDRRELSCGLVDFANTKMKSKWLLSYEQDKKFVGMNAYALVIVREIPKRGD